jgi:hypothetical protein
VIQITQVMRSGIWWSVIFVTKNRVFQQTDNKYVAEMTQIV